MTQSNPVVRVIGWVLGPPIQWIGQRVERRVRRATPDLPEPPIWFVPLVIGIAFVGTAVAQLRADPDQRRSERERVEPEPEATAERGTTSVSDESDEKPVQDALETLEVECPPVPEKTEVKASYRSLAVETHPDQGGDAQEFMEVQEAWEVVNKREELSDGTTDDGGN